MSWLEQGRLLIGVVLFLAWLAAGVALAFAVGLIRLRGGR